MNDSSQTQEPVTPKVVGNLEFIGTANFVLSLLLGLAFIVIALEESGEFYFFWIGLAFPLAGWMQLQVWKGFAEVIFQLFQIRKNTILRKEGE